MPPGDWTLTFDGTAALARIRSISRALSDLSGLHELLVIRAQRWVFKHWPKSPALGSFTMLTRSGSAPLLDTGYLRNSLTGGDPSRVSTAPDTLNVSGPAGGVIGTKARGAALHNFGKDKHVPRTKKFLALPMSIEAKKAGSPLNFGRPLAFIPTKARDGWIMVEGEQYRVRFGPQADSTRIRPKGEHPIAHYLLKLWVRIPARKFFPTSHDFAPDAKRTAKFWLARVVRGQSPTAEAA